ncbi:MAG TPA: DUF1801 domain-containing protein [Verrucomicrobiae bacterium]|nr:DUF1801 domain-containing protein [Verrucomicrobiae bacterium]
MKSSRVPPPKPEHLSFLKPYGREVTKLVLAARELVLKEAPAAVELIYDAYSAVSSGYSFTGRPSDSFVYVAAYAKGVNLGFWDALNLPDPEGLLEGTGKRSRHVKIRALADLERPALRALVEAAIALAERPDSAAPKPESIVRAIYPRRRRPAGPA